MNILHIMQNYKPQIGGAVVRNSSMIETYKKKYNDCIYLVNLGKEKELPDCEIINGVNIIRCRSLLDLVITSCNIINNKGIDVIHTHNFRFMAIGFIAKIISKRNVKIIVELHALYKMSMLKERISYYFLKKCDKIIVLAEAAKKYLIDTYGIPDSKIITIRNGMMGEEYMKFKNFEAYSHLSRAKEKYCIAAYFGTFYDWQGVNFLKDNLDCIMSNNEKLFLALIGNGPEFKNVYNSMNVSKYRDRIYITSSIDKVQLLNLYELVDFIIIPRLKNLSTNTAIPLKAVEAMQNAKCILSGDDNGLREVLNEDNAMIFVSGDSKSFQRSVSILVDNTDLRIKLGEKAKNDIGHICETWEQNVEKLHKVYEMELYKNC